ncbi:MAG TPA: tetratricopeptide repeat protein [Burkholderiales bacterium]|nr:tetratricopeptide repeat protein [Burkholderiales bacterium]
MRAHRQGDYAGAIAAYRLALAATPDHPRAAGLLGTALLQSGDAPQALRYLAVAVSKQRHDAGLLATLAQAYFATEQFVPAADAFRKAARINPAEPQFTLGLANSLAMQGQHGDARRLLERLVARHPAHAMAWFNFGNVLRDLHELAPATEAYRKALTLAPDFIEARNALGSVLHSSLKLVDAEREYRQCIRDAPLFLPAYQNLASVLIDQGQFDAAESACRDIIRLDPSNAQAHGMLADSFNVRGRLVEAARHYEDAMRLAPDDMSIRLSHAAKLCDTGDIDGGLRSFRELIQRAPDLPGLHHALATTLLAHGFLAEGWAEYRQRPAFLAFREKLSHVALTQTLPEKLQGLQVCVLREQGLGDEIFFLRYAQMLHQRGARITYRASRAIASLVKRLPELADVIDAEAAPPACDAAIMVGDLPHALGVLPASLRATSSASAAPVSEDSLWTFPWSQPNYSPLPQPSIRIAALPEQLANTRTQLAQIGPPPYIGITWRGGTPPSEQGAGSWLLFKTLDIPRLGAALRSYRGTFIALQRNPEPGEIAAMEAAAGTRVHDFTNKNKYLEEMLALLTLIDEYVGVSNTNMHLRACVGKAARVLVPAPAEWRWIAAGSASPWFPAFSVYRQTVNGEWAEALDQLKNDLAASLKR